jgi:N-methylhydantoinase B
MIKLANNLSSLLIGKMLDASPTYHRRASAVWDGAHSSIHLSGKQHGGEGFIVSITDPFAGSGGAQATKDGVDIGGEVPNAISRWANAETHEMHNPVLFLYRGVVADSGGPGRYRGGVSAEFALVPHDADGGEIELVVTAKGLRSPMSHGISGGLPGCNYQSCFIRDANVDEMPESWDDTRGEFEDAQWGSFTFGERDILYQHKMGGGGYGDPLARPAEEVAADLETGVVSAVAARDQYGVVLDDAGATLAEETATLRLQMRAERLGRPVDAKCSSRADVPATGMRVNEYLQRCPDGTQCTWCGELVADESEPWKSGAVRREVPPASAGRFRESLEELVLREYHCPRCATLLHAEVARKDDPELDDEIRGWPESAPA